MFGYTTITAEKRLIDGVVCSKGETSCDFDLTFGNQMKCPVCGYTYVRIETMNTERSDSYEAWEGRGDADFVYMSGECGHKWRLRFGFHKGETFVSVEIPR